MTPARARAARLPSLVVPATVLALVLGAGCTGSDSASDDETISLSSWRRQVNALCTEARADVEQVDAPTSASDFATWKSSGAAVQQRIATFVEDVDQLGTPSTRGLDAKEFVDQWRVYGAAFDPVVAAAGDRDADAVETAAEHLQAVNDKKDELAAALGLDECTGDHSGDTTTTEPSATTAAGLPPAAWSAEIEAACARLTEKYSSISTADPATPAEAQQVANDLNSFATELVAEWDRIGPPEGETAVARQLYDQFVRFKAIATEFQNAVAASDAEAVSRGAEQLDQVTAQIGPLADRLHVPSCGT